MEQLLGLLAILAFVLCFPKIVELGIVLLILFLIYESIKNGNYKK